MARRSVTEERWHAAAHPMDIWYTRFVRNERKRRLVVCACARRVLPVLQNDPRAVALIEACERHADSPAREARAVWNEVVAARGPVRDFVHVFRDPQPLPLPPKRATTAYQIHDTLDPTDTVSPLTAPAAIIRVADLLP
jgi:hypothetical protein